MPNYIITANGTRFVEEGAARRRTRKTILIMLAILVTPFLIAAFAGITMGIMEMAEEPSRKDITRLVEGDKIDIPPHCWVEMHEVRCD